MRTDELPRLRQSPTDPGFVQDPYPFYEAARAAGEIVWWEDYGLPVAVSAAAVDAVLKHRHMGRQPIAPPPVAPHARDFYAVEAHSMLELEPPRHTRLRGLVLRAFTTRRIASLGPQIATLAHELIDAFPDEPFDLLDAWARRIPVIVIARLLGVPEAISDRLLTWSNAMVGMYQARRTRETEMVANRAAAEFAAFMRGYVEERRAAPADDLITALIRAEEDGEKLTTDELITTCILLLNAGHEATVHSLGNGVKTLLESHMAGAALRPEAIEATVEEILRFDPPLHMFTRHVYDETRVAGVTLPRGAEIGCLLAAANRDPSIWDAPARFDPTRPVRKNASFGAGLHFCVGAPLARLEMQTTLPILFERCPELALVETPAYANLYHFHGLERLMVRR